VRPAGVPRSPRCSILITVLLAAVLLSCMSGSALAANKAPKVTKDPAAVTVEEGHSATFEATASGVPAPTVQWELSTNAGGSWSPVTGATSNQLTIASTNTSESGDEYRAVFKNVAGQATSKAATLTVQRLPAVTKDPASVTVEEGQGASFEAAASGFPAPTVQWEVSTNAGSTWSQIKGATSGQLTIASAKTSENGNEFRAAFTNAAGKATSTAATLTVHNAPKVTKQPANATVEVGQNATFEAAASGFPAPTVQWEVSSDGGGSWSPLAGANSDQLTIADAQASESGDEYRAVFENVAGGAVSQAAKLTVQDPPKVTAQPASTTVEAGEGASFEASASGVPTPTVQWELSTNAGATWSPVSGATSEQLTIAETQATESGHEYRAVFENAAGKATTTPATLTVVTHHYDVVDWGEGAFGQLGAGSTANSDVPVTASGLRFVSAVAGGNHHSLALLSGGTVMAWGEDAFGQLGDGSEGVSSDVPVAVQGLTGVKAIAAGSNHNLALLANGTVVAWGANEVGQLGDAGTEESETPVPVTGLTGVTAIAAGGNHSLALLSNGTVKAWGENAMGQLGDGNTKNSTTPVAVKNLTGVTAIAAGGEHSLAVLGGGAVKAWGSDSSGQLGGGPVEGEPEELHSDVPVTVNGLSGASAVAAGARHSLALLGAGTVMAWGEDRAGQLGDGVIAPSDETPVAVSGLSGVTAIAAGGEHSLALLGAGGAMAWGEDKFGELGDGSFGEASDVPVAVSGLGEVVGIAAGSLHDLAYGEPIPGVTVVSPCSGPAAGGTSVTVTGLNFTGATAVSFGGVAATEFTVNSAKSITARAPTHAAGTVDVTVTTPAGMSPASAGDKFTYIAAPVVTQVSPKKGPAAGGSMVTITGTGFSEASAVSFGSTPAKSFTIKSATSILAESPPHASGTVDVTVSTQFATSAPSAHDRFKFKK